MNVSLDDFHHVGWVSTCREPSFQKPPAPPRSTTVCCAPRCFFRHEILPFARNFSSTMLQCRHAALTDQPICTVCIVGGQNCQLHSPQIGFRYRTEIRLPLRSVGGCMRSLLRGGSSVGVLLRDSSVRSGSRLGAGERKKAMAFTGEEMSVELKHAGYEGPAVSIPKLGLGVYQASPSDTVQAVTHALRNGYRHIDTAHLYGNEQAVGKAVRDSKIPREEVFVTTKLWNSDHGYENTLKAFDRSLKELNLGYVDLYLVHSPMAVGKRIDTWRAMEEILKSGKAKAIGVSNYGVHHLQELFAHCTIRPSVNQVELTPFCSREKLVKFCEGENIVLESYSPLTKGYRLNDKTLVEIGKEYNKTPAQVLIRWCLQKDFVVLPKSVNPQRIVENSQVFDFNLADKHMAKLDSLEEDWGASWDPTKGP